MGLGVEIIIVMRAVNHFRWGVGVAGVKQGNRRVLKGINVFNGTVILNLRIYSAFYLLFITRQKIFRKTHVYITNQQEV